MGIKEYLKQYLIVFTRDLNRDYGFEKYSGNEILNIFRNYKLMDYCAYPSEAFERTYHKLKTPIITDWIIYPLGQENLFLRYIVDGRVDPAGRPVSRVEGTIIPNNTKPDVVIPYLENELKNHQIETNNYGYGKETLEKFLANKISISEAGLFGIINRFKGYAYQKEDVKDISENQSDERNNNQEQKYLNNQSNERELQKLKEENQYLIEQLRVKNEKIAELTKIIEMINELTNSQLKSYNAKEFNDNNKTY